jgi:hypothetical protein
MIKITYDEDGAQWLTDEIHEGDFGTFVAWHRRSSLGKVNFPRHEEYLERVPAGALRVPVYLYEHGGMALSTEPFSCPWDSGQVGIWIFTSEDLVKVYGEDTDETRATAVEGVAAQLRYMTDVYAGNVWRFESEDDACGGFVGDAALEDMKGYLPEELHGELEAAWEGRHA